MKEIDDPRPSLDFILDTNKLIIECFEMKRWSNESRFCGLSFEDIVL